MSSLLFSWVAGEDLRRGSDGGVGSLERVLAAGDYDEAHLLSPFDRLPTSTLADALWSRTNVRVVPHVVELPPGDEALFGRIHAVAAHAVATALERRPDARLTFHLGSGTGAMIASWIVLARTRFPAGLVQVSEHRGVETEAIPFDVSVEYVTAAAKRLQSTSAVATAAFRDAAAPMAETFRRAEHVAMTDVAVLLEGPPGVETEALARFIHERSRRADRRFVSFNCRSVPPERIVAELFGQAARIFEPPFDEERGQLESAPGATFFLDEITAIPLEGQARLARLISEGSFTRPGGATRVPVDARIIAGTSREPRVGLSEGRFLPDLVLQLSVAAIRIPSVGERRDELPGLIDRLFTETSERYAAMTPKRLSSGARNVLLSRTWPGNEAEIRTALTRLVVWSDIEEIAEEDVRQLLPSEGDGADGILGRPFSEGFRLEDVLDEVSRSYIGRALRETDGVKAKAVELLGMSNATTLTNWMKRLGIDGGPGRPAS